MWSLGCILYQLVYQKLPWDGLSVSKKLIAITQESFQIAFPPISSFFASYRYVVATRGFSTRFVCASNAIRSEDL